MKGVSEIKSRIGGVRDTLKITKAMYVISAAKLPKTQADLATAKVYQATVDKAVSRLNCPLYADNPYLVGNADGKRTGYIVIAGDKGLCGDYNDRVLRTAWEKIGAEKDCKVFAVGYMSKMFFANKGVKMNNAFTHMMQNPLPEDAGQIAEKLIADIAESKLSKVYIVYTKANKLHDQEVVCEQLLPLPYPKSEENIVLSQKEEDINELLHTALEARIYAALRNASCALTYKHMSSMREAANNGEDMLEELTQHYNHARQAAITAELNDVNVARMANEETE